MNTEDSAKREYYERMAADLAVLFSSLFFPWWISVALIFLGALFLRNFYEAFFFGLLLDALYGTESVNFYGFRLLFASMGLFSIFVSAIIKKKVRFFA
ncbi:MAG: hypothetical protein WC878_01730 [Candidatus Paceibacterota bacterium]|jgi:hypothetical protein